MIDETLKVLVDDLADPDPSIRDERALAGLVEALLGDESVSDATAAAVHGYALRATGPLQSCGEPAGGDGVFGRSFTMELLAILQHRDNERPFLADKAWRASVSALVLLTQREQDFRAQVDACGWAHVVAHSADLADELLASPRCERRSATQVLESLVMLASRCGQLFAGEEEDRIALALAGAISRDQLKVSALEKLLGDPQRWEVASVRRVNWKSVVRSLAFRMDQPLGEPTVRELCRLEESLTRL